jgi:flagellar operon protein (TIGR03826 family)
MALGKLANCTRCDMLFLMATRDICQKCYIEVEQEYEKCARFLRKRENRGSTIHQVSEATGVTVKQITRFIKEGRISIVDNPHMGYPCESCGILIRSGNLCDACAGGLKREIVQQLDVDKRLAEEQRQKNAAASYRSKTNHDE